MVFKPMVFLKDPTLKRKILTIRLQLMTIRTMVIVNMLRLVQVLKPKTNFSWIQGHPRNNKLKALIRFRLLVETQ
jgi:hypothetical protein